MSAVSLTNPLPTSLHSDDAAAALCALVAQRQSQASHANGVYAHDDQELTIPVPTEVAYVSSLSQ